MFLNRYTPERRNSTPVHRNAGTQGRPSASTAHRHGTRTLGATVTCVPPPPLAEHGRLARTGRHHTVLARSRGSTCGQHLPAPLRHPASRCSNQGSSGQRKSKPAPGGGIAQPVPTQQSKYDRAGTGGLERRVSWLDWRRDHDERETRRPTGPERSMLRCDLPNYIHAQPHPVVHVPELGIEVAVIRVCRDTDFEDNGAPEKPCPTS